MKSEETPTIHRSRKLFLNNMGQLGADLRIISGRDKFLAGSLDAGATFRGEAWFRLIVKTVISFALLSAGLYILLSGRFGEDMKKIGSGFIGTAAGYWLA
jgi:hypothetical protein